MDDLKSLVTSARGGDLSAFEQLIKQFQTIALRYAYTILRNHDQAQDAVQEAFIQAYLSLPNLHEPAAFPVWFRSIVSNCSRRLMRGRRFATVPLEDVSDVPASAPNPHEIVEKQDLASRVVAAVRHLPEHERVVTSLFYFGDHSQRDIAEMLGLPLTTVNNRLHSSRKHLRQRVGDIFEPPYAAVRSSQNKPKEATMALIYEPTTRKLPKGDVTVTVRAMTWEDIPAMRRLDEEIAAGVEFANAQRSPESESCPGGPWSDDEEIRIHYERYFLKGNMALVAEDQSGRLIGFADLWVGREPEPFGDSLDVQCIDFIWEYFGLGIEIALLEEAENVARAAGIPALDIGTNTSSGDYASHRRFGMKVFYEYDFVICKCNPPTGWQPSYRTLTPDSFDTSGLIRVSHWAPSDFYGFGDPHRPGTHEFYVDGHRIVADFWRLWEPGYEVPTECQLFAPPEALSSPQLMSRILREAAFIASTLGSHQLPLPCPCDLAIDPALVDVINREFAFAWMRKNLT